MSETISFPIASPQFTEYFRRTRATTRVCAHPECEDLATFIDGHYLVENRRVRVWTCWTHWHGDIRRVLPTPASIQAALDAEREYQARMEKRLRTDVEPERGVSVKYLTPTGFGTAVEFDRVKAWRWDGLSEAQRKTMKKKRDLRARSRAKVGNPNGERE